MLLAAAVGLVSAGCASGIARHDLAGQLQTPAAPRVVDVRTAGEFAAGHMPGAINISVFSLPFRIDEIDSPKDEPVVVYCAHGPRASMAGLILRLVGFTRVYHLAGDLKGWRKSGLPMATPSAPALQPPGTTRRDGREVR